MLNQRFFRLLTLICLGIIMFSLWFSVEQGHSSLALSFKGNFKTKEAAAFDQQIDPLRDAYTYLNGHMHLDIPVQNHGPLAISINRFAGDVVYKRLIRKAPRRYRTDLDVTFLAKGVYVVKIKTRESVLKRVLIRE